MNQPGARVVLPLSGALTHKPPYNHPSEVSSSGGRPQGRLGRGRSVRFSNHTIETQRPAQCAPPRRPPPVKCHSPVRCSTWRSLNFKHRGCGGGRLRLPFVVGFLVGFLRVALASFLRLGRLFSGLGRLFWGLGCLVCVFFFRSFVVFFGLVPWVLPCFLRLLPWWLRSASPVCVLSSRGLCWLSLRASARLHRVVWLRRVLLSLVPWSVGVCALGRSLGRSLPWSLVPGVCRCCRVGSLPRAFSFRSFRSRALWHPPRGAACLLVFFNICRWCRSDAAVFFRLFAALDGGKKRL